MSTDETTSTTDQMVRYLSLAWIRELTREVAESEVLADLANEHRIGVTQVVTAGPEGDVTYHLQVGDGSATLRCRSGRPRGRPHAAGVVDRGRRRHRRDERAGGLHHRQDPALRRPAEAVDGRNPVFGALDQVFSIVRERTRYE
jgi:hypothetical protein